MVLPDLRVGFLGLGRGFTTGLQGSHESPSYEPLPQIVQYACWTVKFELPADQTDSKTLLRIVD